MLWSNQRNSMGFYSSSVVDVCKIALFPSLKNASQLVASSPNFGQVAQESDSIQISQLHFFRNFKRTLHFKEMLQCRRNFKTTLPRRSNFKKTLQVYTSTRCNFKNMLQRRSNFMRKLHFKKMLQRRRNFKKRYKVAATSRGGHYVAVTSRVKRMLHSKKMLQRNSNFKRTVKVEASSRGRYTVWQRCSNWRETCVTWRRYESVRWRVCGHAREGPY